MTREWERLLLVGGLLIALFVLRVLTSGLPWPYIAASLALIAVLLTLVAEEKRAFGDAYDTPEVRDEPERVSARNLARGLMGVALAFVLFSALVPVLELPARDDFIRIGNRVSEVTFTDDDGKQRLNPDVLKSVLTDLDGRIGDAMSRDPGGQLLVQNCGVAATCECPAGFQPIPDSGEWNLNDKTQGSAIRLCSKGPLR